jgi:hypothetical protein
MQDGQTLSSKNRMQSGELLIPSPGSPLPAFDLQSSQWGVMKMFKGAKVIGMKFQNRTGRQIHGLDSISMVWEYDRALLEGWKDAACYPLDRNRLQMQDTERLGQTKVNTWWISLEGKGDGPQRPPACEGMGGYRQDSASSYK